MDGSTEKSEKFIRATTKKKKREKKNPNVWNMIPGDLKGTFWLGNPAQSLVSEGRAALAVTVGVSIQISISPILVLVSTLILGY